MGEANFYYFTCLNEVLKENRLVKKTIPNKIWRIKRNAHFRSRKTSFSMESSSFSAGKMPRSKNVGLGFKTPNEAKDGVYIDKKCPFTGLVQIRGRILTGVVQKMKMQRTIVVRRDYLHFIRKYKRFEKRHK